MTTILDNQYWAYGQAPDIRFTLKYDLQRVGVDMQYKFYFTIHSLNTPTSGFGWPIYATISLDGSSKLSGATVKGTNPMKWYGSELTYETGWLTVSNKQNGTTAFKLTLYSGAGMERTQTWNATLAVSDLSSSFSVADFKFGESVTVNINKAKETNTHTVKITVGSHSRTQSNVDSSYSYTIPLSWCDAVTDATSMNATVQVTTYDNGEKVGSTQSKTVKATVPSSVVPTISVVKTTLFGIGNRFLAGYSKLKLTATADGIYGSTITDISFVIGNETHNGTDTEFTSDTLTVVGTVRCSVVVTDSRGRVGKYASSINVLSYSPPKINTASIFRSLENGAFSESGTAVFVKALATHDEAIPGNSLTLTVAYKERDAYFYSDPESITNNVGSVHFSTNITLTKMYDIMITATDAAGNQATYIATVTTSSNYMITARGRKVCLGGYVDLTKTDGTQVVGDLHVTGIVRGSGRTARLLNETIYASTGERTLDVSGGYSIYCFIVARANGGGRITEFIPDAYVNGTERYFTPYLYDGQKQFRVITTNGQMTIKNTSDTDLAFVIYGVM